MEQISLHFRCEGLPNTLSLGTIDPVAKVSLVSAPFPETLLGNTETVIDSCDPSWVKNFVIDYKFEIDQEIIVRVFHGQTQLGQCRFRLSEMMAHTGSVFKQPLTDGPAAAAGSQIVVLGESMTCTRDIFHAKFRASGLNRMNGLGVFSKSDPFIEVSKVFENGEYGVVYKSPVIKNELNPCWAEASIPMATLCNGDIDRPLRMTFFDHEESGKHQYMGEVETTVRRLLQEGKTPAEVGAGWPIVEKAKKGTHGYTNSGTFTCHDASIEKHPSFTEYLLGGLEMSLVVAIDFTASNGDPADPHSLHYRSDAQPNAYQRVIEKVGRVVEPYDSDKLFPVMGFGGRLRQLDGSLGPVSHCFTIDESANGVPGILQAYKDVMPKMGLSGPTIFHQVIDSAAATAAAAHCSPESQKYFVLLIITDGVITDLEETKQSIIRASALPLSIIIVGVGAEDFSSMHLLDSDDKDLVGASGKHKAVRDIVQFVPVRDFKDKPDEALAAAVLAEIPSAVVHYMNMRSMPPNPNKVVTASGLRKA